MNHMNAAASKQAALHYRQPVSQKIRKCARAGFAVSAIIIAIGTWRLLSIAPTSTQKAVFEGKVVNNIFYNSISKDFPPGELAREVQSVRDADSSVPRASILAKGNAMRPIPSESRESASTVSSAESAMERAGFVLRHTRMGYSDSFWSDFVQQKMGGSASIGDLDFGIMKSEDGSIVMDAKKVASIGAQQNGAEYLAAIEVHESGHKALGHNGISGYTEDVKSPFVFRLLSAIFGSRISGQFDKALSMSSKAIDHETKATVYSFRFLDDLSRQYGRDYSGIYTKMAVNIAQWKDFTDSLYQAAYAASAAIIGAIGSLVSALMLIGLKVKEKFTG